MKILKWLSGNFLFVLTIFLLAFIPLYPKLPLLDVVNTWVYVRAEDFIVVLSVLVWVTMLIFKKVSLKTPLTIPIFIFWIIGGLSTIHGVLLLFPTLSDVFSNVAFLSMLRRIEYMSLFFIAFASIKSKKHINYVAITLAVVLLLVVGYGVGQKFFSLPAFLTMNEEFAKGIPIRLSQLSRVPSTFAGHYDLAAYLVLVIPLLTSLAFGFRDIIFKIFLLATASFGFVLLFMTVSRVSFFVLLFSMLMLLVLQKKKLIIGLFLVLTFALLIFSPSLLERFRSTVSEVNVLVDAKTGGAIGQVKEVPSGYFKDKIIRRIADSDTNALSASVSATLPFQLIPPIVPLVVEANNSSTGESLPQGTSYVNLPLSQVIKKVDMYFSQKLTSKAGVESEEISVFYGDFLIKKAKAYDLSFTTRFQGEWPKTFDAFKRNIFLGSGYGSVSLAVDNNYLRILGESGLLGLLSFLSIFLIAGLYIQKILPKVDDPVTRNFVLAFVAGTFGLMLNAIFIDVFEASKVAFIYWLLMGITLGTLTFYKTWSIDLYKEFKNAITSPFAIIVYLFIVTVALYFSGANYYFTGDDFTWFNWVENSRLNIPTFINYFTQADGFFYRPGTKIYFSFMYSSFWLNQTMYHAVSIFLHFAVSALLFLIVRKIFKDYILSIISAVLFIILSGHHEDIFWISSTGFLFNAMFALAGLLSFMVWKEKKKIIYFVISLASISSSLMFHELGVIVPLLIILYDLIFGENLIINKLSRKASYKLLLLPILPYLALRFLAQSHWFSGDYSYNIFKLPYNFLGNTVGYVFLDLLGPQSLSFYEGLRNFSREHMIASVPLSFLIIFGLAVGCRKIMRKIEEKDLKIIIFGFLFFIIGLLPFLGLGNITSRYSYLSSVGFVILFAFLLKKSYVYLISISDKYIGTAAIVIIVIVYFMVQLFGLQKIHSDWQRAGEESKRFLISIEEYSKDFWIRDSLQFYFVNMPIRQGEAWVWPVGLKDALWLTFKNPNLAVYTVSDVNFALNQAQAIASAHVFRFDKNGNVEEISRTKKGQIILVNPPR